MYFYTQIRMQTSAFQCVKGFWVTGILLSALRIQDRGHAPNRDRSPGRFHDQGGFKKEQQFYCYLEREVNE
jgi:hypothetical protein